MSRVARPAGRRTAASAGVAAPADRRFRRADVRPDRRRFGRLVLRSLRWLVPMGLVLAAAVWMVDAMLQARVLSVQHVTVRGNARLTKDDVLSLVGDVRGENILQVDLQQYRRRVMDSPWIADVTLRRVLPATIDVEVVERRPLVTARLGDQLYLVDSSGAIIDEFGSQYRDLDLPIVDGLVGPAGKAGALVDHARVQLTDALLSVINTWPDLRRRLSQVDVSNAHDAVVMFDNDPVWLHLGESQFAERLRTYLELGPTLKEQFRDIDYIDLRFDKRVFVHSRGKGPSASRSVRLTR